MKNKKIVIWAVVVLILLVIGAGGYFAYQKFYFQKITSNLINQINNWKTYKSDNYGFQIQYPNTITVNEVPADLNPFYDWHEVDFYNKDKNLEISISLWTNDNNYKTLDDLVKGETKMQKEGFASVIPAIPAKTEKFVLDGIPAIKWYYKNEEYDDIGVSIVTLKGKYFYQIEGKPYSEKYISKFTEEEENLFNQMFSTLKFTK